MEINSVVFTILDRMFHYMDYGVIFGFLAYVIPIEILEHYKIFAPYVVGIYLILKTAWILIKWLLRTR